MAKDEPYDMIPHKDIIELKNQLQKLMAEKLSSQELTNSLNALAKSTDSMLRLFKEAAEELKVEDKEYAINKKLNEIIEQNKIIADGMIAVSDMIKDLIAIQKDLKSIQAQPSFQPQEPDFNLQPLEPSFNEPSLQFDQPVPKPGPVAMPSIPFSSIEAPKPRKKGLFGRVRQ